MQYLKVFLVCLILPSVSWAGVYKLDPPIQKTTASGMKYSEVIVTCDSSNIHPEIRKNDGAVKWCSAIDPSMCATSKMALAIKTCKSGHLRKIRQANDEKNVTGISGTSEPEKQVAKKTEIEVERERIEIEKQRVELEKQKVILQQLEAELQKLEFELERDSKAN